MDEEIREKLEAVNYNMNKLDPHEIEAFMLEVMPLCDAWAIAIGVHEAICHAEAKAIQLIEFTRMDEPEAYAEAAEWQRANGAAVAAVGGL